LNLDDFNRASSSFKELNRDVFGVGAPAALRPPVLLSAPARVVRRRAMNNTEREFAALLAARVRSGELDRCDFEGMTLR